MRCVEKERPSAVEGLKQVGVSALGALQPSAVSVQNIRSSPKSAQKDELSFTDVILPREKSPLFKITIKEIEALDLPLNNLRLFL